MTRCPAVLPESLFRVNPVNHTKIITKPTGGRPRRWTITARGTKDNPLLAVRTTALLSAPILSIARLALPEAEGDGQDEV